MFGIKIRTVTHSNVNITWLLSKTNLKTTDTLTWIRYASIGPIYYEHFRIVIFRLIQWRWLVLSTLNNLYNFITDVIPLNAYNLIFKGLTYLEDPLQAQHVHNTILTKSSLLNASSAHTKILEVYSLTAISLFKNSQYQHLVRLHGVSYLRLDV